MHIGYLKEEGCTSAYKMFLKEMKDLQEYRELLEAGEEYPTCICGKSLKMMLNEYGCFTIRGEYRFFISRPIS